MISVNINKAKGIAHNIRRNARAEEFKPLDEIIMKQIPGINVQAVEAERQAVRDKYSEMQIAIDNASTVEQIKEVLP